MGKMVLNNFPSVLRIFSKELTERLGFDLGGLQQSTVEIKDDCLQVHVEPFESAVGCSS